MKQKNEALFQANLERFARFWPKTALRLETQDTDNKELKWVLTKKGEPNLAKTAGREKIYYHSQEGAVDEAKRWSEEVSPLGIRVLFVYGIGLGYYYDALEEWLSFDPMRFLIFIEDDLEVLRKFLETERAARILTNTQVIVHYFPTPGERDWGKFRLSFDISLKAF